MSKAEVKKSGKPDTSQGKRKGEPKVEEIVPPEPENNPEQNIVQIETEGFGKFEFIDGTIYEGQWKLINGVKMRHGEGTLKHSGIVV